LRLFPSYYTNVMVGCMLPATRSTTRLGRGNYSHVPVIRLTLNPSSSPILRAWNRQSLPDSGWLKKARRFFFFYFSFFLLLFRMKWNDLTFWHLLLIVLVKYHLMQNFDLKLGQMNSKGTFSRFELLKFFLNKLQYFHKWVIKNLNLKYW